MYDFLFVHKKYKNAVIFKLLKSEKTVLAEMILKG